MKILILHHYAGSIKHGMSYRVYYLAREWVRAGHEVHIHAASYSHLRTIQPKVLKEKLGETIDGIKYTWHRTPAYKKNGAGRVLNMAVFVWRMYLEGKKIANTFKPDVVIASSTYPMDIWPANRIAKIAKAKLVFEVHDLWPLSPMELGGMSKWHPFIILVQRAEDYAYRYSDTVISMLPKAKEYMVSRGMESSKFHYVPNGIDTSEWENPKPLPEPVNTVLEQLKKNGLPIVGYAGTHGLANALDSLLDAAIPAQGKFEVVLVGTGPEREKLQLRVKNERIHNVTLLPAIPKDAVPSFLAAIDIAFIGWHKNPLYRFGISPNKLMDYMMAGKPVIHAVEAGNDPVAEAGCGITVPPGDSIAIREAISALANLSSIKREIMGNKGKQFVLASQTYPVLAKSFLGAIGVA